MGCILKLELADRRAVNVHRSSGTLPECCSESLKQLEVPLAVISWTRFAHIPGSVVTMLICMPVHGTSVEMVFLMSLLHYTVIYILKSKFYGHWWNFSVFLK